MDSKQSRDPIDVELQRLQDLLQTNLIFKDEYDKRTAELLQTKVIHFTDLSLYRGYAFCSFPVKIVAIFFNASIMTSSNALAFYFINAPLGNFSPRISTDYGQKFNPSDNCAKK